MSGDIAPSDADRSQAWRQRAAAELPFFSGPGGCRERTVRHVDGHFHVLILVLILACSNEPTDRQHRGLTHRASVLGAPPSLYKRRLGPRADPASGLRSVAQLARAPVSKTGGWGFESLHSCQRFQ
jgi:hypothetical protein